MKLKITYWVSTVLFATFILMGVFQYIFNTAEVSKGYVALGFPIWVLYFNGTAKVLGIIAILWGRQPFKEWAYAGLAYVLLLAVVAHIVIADGLWIGAAIGLVLWCVSYFSDRFRKK